MYAGSQSSYRLLRPRRMQPGNVIAERFEIGKLVGAGAMGAVFRARDRETGEDVAVKVMLDVAGRSEARFEREAQVLAGMNHPHVVRYVAHGVSARDEAYLVMEWIEGEDLSRLLSRGRLRVEACVALGARVASALAEAHARGVIHRDLKPSNLILAGGEVARVTVLDFGIAWISGASRATQTGSVLGTPGYLPPEQARGEEDLDPRADLFSLGCVLFECLTGAPAFSGQHLPAILAKILFEPAPSVRILCPEAPEPLGRLIARMLSKDPGQRPTSAEAAATLGALDLVIEGSGPVSHRAPLHAPLLTGDEQRVLSVVMIGAPGPRARDSARDVEMLHQAALARGARLERMADGSMAAILLDALSPLDEAFQAARLALGLHAIIPGRAIVMATGRSGGLFKPTVGDAINRAVRLLDACARAGEQPRAPLVDKATAQLLGARFDVRAAGLGLELVGERDPLASARTLLGRASPYVGRKTEFATLTGLFTECVEESVARAAVVTAPAGVGKSRLAYEVLRAAREISPSVAIWTAQGDVLRAGAAFGLLGQAIRAAADLRDGEPLAMRRDKLRARVAERVPAPDRARVTEFLGELVGVPFPDDASPPLFAARTNARLLREQMLRAWADFLRAECTARPVLLMLDDLQWGDTSTIRSVGMALESLKGLPFFVLALARPEVSQLFPKLWEEQGALTLRLRELTRKASVELVRQTLGADVSAELLDRLVTQANGHAFYLEELIRTVAEGRGDATPATLLAIIEARLQQLAPEARRVLRAASIFGEVFWSGGVSALLGGAPVREIERHLDALAGQEVLAARADGRSRFSGEAEYVFLNGLLRESAYATLTEEDRALGHRLAGEWLEQHGDGDPLVLAEHFGRGRQHDRAGLFYLRASEEAYRAGDSDATIARAQRGLATKPPGELRGALLGVLCETHMSRFEWTAAASLIDEAMRLVRPGTTPWVHVATARFGLLVLQGAFDALPAHVALIQSTPIDPEALSFVAQSLGIAIIILHTLGQLDVAAAALSRLDELLQPVTDRDRIARGWLEIARCAQAVWADDDPWRGLVWARAADESFESTGYPGGLRVAQLFIGMCLWRLGALDEAERTLRGLSLDWELGELALLQDDYLARVLLDRGALEAARVVASSLIKKSREVRVARYEGRGRWLLARVHHQAGDLDAAAREALAALEQMPAAFGCRVAAQVTLAAIRLAQGRADDALALAEEAVRADRARRGSGMHRTYASLVHAEALAATGAADRAHEAIDDAYARLLDDADKIGDAAVRECFLEHVPENARVARLAAARPARPARRL